MTGRLCVRICGERLTGEVEWSALRWRLQRRDQCVASLVVQLTKSTGCGANLRREVRGDVDPSPWEAAPSDSQSLVARRRGRALPRLRRLHVKSQ